MRLWVVGLLSLAAVTAFAQPRTNHSEAAAPRPAAFRETRFSFGEVDKGQRVTHSFVFKNLGNTELKVKAVTPT